MIGFQAPLPEAGFSEKLSEIPLRFREAPVKNLVAFLAIRGPGLLRTAPFHGLEKDSLWFPLIS